MYNYAKMQWLTWFCFCCEWLCVAKIGQLMANFRQEFEGRRAVTIF
jgi:hypothetical protein